MKQAIEANRFLACAERLCVTIVDCHREAIWSQKHIPINWIAVNRREFVWAVQ